ncbi:PepSY domain-containing protein [Salinimonas sp. HHU 13199]|uniref:PepSY domain-containing protein n=1 Tax=Salinimonas profundi TaxID=2729140 RepID=A0ABR8LPU8_9ALTE|nr:PepSY-associated TM helix domain-containing protein [Salinimonas profundi]MBD3587340.1 PepSY domain-containing protein [Salinimonas profundi]
MAFGISRKLSKRALQGHSWLGLAVGVLLYWVCLSGTVAVLGNELVRWEQPNVAETLEYSPAALQRAYRQMLQEQGDISTLVTMRLPTPDMPRAFLSANGNAWYIDDAGTLSQTKSHPITDFIAEFHAQLHLPHTFGELFVSILGALLTVLIVSGVVAHRRIFKDAFTFRGGADSSLKQADLHNRLSVWGLPFHLMIALTGAYFGLGGPLNTLYAEAMYEGDKGALFGEVFGEVPDAPAYYGKMDLGHALASLDTVAPDARPLFITFERPGEDDEFLLLGAQHTDMFIYSEQYRFDAMGNYLDAVGFAQGHAGQEAIFSVYRLHFGHFGSVWILLSYLVLGMALTVICVSGINLWFKKRQITDALNDYWAAVVWGTPASFLSAALAGFAIPSMIVPLFWGAFVMSCSYAVYKRDPHRVSQQLRIMTALLLLALALTSIVLHGWKDTSPAFIAINSGIISLAVCLLSYFAFKKASRQATSNLK